MSFMPFTALSGRGEDLGATVFSAMALVGAASAVQFEG
jgi:hypothetical protein